ncbi:hypothetical protein AGOR_G00148090 [Albula goreensis]|uniref:Ig-like domain-containing protein n=1 Tax=Albula goreensis TaxID=1534307 RepID=A0A8T3D5G8_9TELE|nr:hypothetical protein AGOR_G00148090 [Albula goreensis]
MKEIIRLLLFSSIALSGLWCQAITSMSVTVGQKAALDCLLHTGNSTGIVSWYKQTPGQGPQFILSYSTNNTFQVSYGHGFNSSRFSVLAKHNETHQHQLLITRTKEPDNAVYYCGLSKNMLKNPADQKLQV